MKRPVYQFYMFSVNNDVSLMHVKMSKFMFNLQFCCVRMLVCIKCLHAQYKDRIMLIPYHLVTDTLSMLHRET
jgi:hypothetical protein